MPAQVQRGGRAQRTSPGEAERSRTELDSRLSPLVGRSVELGALSDRLELAGRGDGGAIFVRGEPGIGKSRLLAEFASTADADGWCVLRGRAYDMEGMPPYLPFIEALREHVHHAPRESLARLASGAPELCVLLPEIRDLVPSLPQAASLGPEADRFRLFESVAGFLVGIAGQPEFKGLLLSLDDLHWADKTSVLLLQHIVRRRGDARLLIAAAYRATGMQPDHPLYTVPGELTREHGGKHITVPALSESETSALIESLAGRPVPDALTLTIHRETSGNPFFVEELVRHLLERDSSLSAASAAIKGIPDGVRQLINGRLASLREPANSALQTAAVLGDSFAFDTLSAATDLDAVSLIEAVEEAERAGMLREEPDGYAFAHALIRRTIYDGLSLPRRQRNHLRIAEAMEAAGIAEADASRAVLAHHWRAAGHPERATDLLLRAGDAALSLTAWEEAAKHWESALECMEKTGDPAVRRARLLEGLGDLYFLSTFEAHPSVERYLQATELYEVAGDPVSAARSRSRAGRSLTYPTSGFDYETAVDYLRAAEKVLSAEPPSVELGELYAALAHAESHALRYGLDEMLSVMERLREVSELVDDDFLRDLLRIQSYHLEGHFLGLQGHLAEGLAMEEFASETALALEENPGGATQWPMRWREILLAYSSSDRTSATDDAGSVQFSRAHTRRGLVNLTTGCSGWQILDLNDPLPARVKHERVRDPQGRIFAPFLPYDLFLCGDLESLRRVAEAGPDTLNPMANAGGIARALLAWGEGRWSEAQEGINLGGAGANEIREAGSRGALVFVNRWLFRLTRIIGDFESGESILQESLRISLSSGAVKYEFFARAEMALLLAQTGRLAEAEPHLARCREILADGEEWRGLGGRLALAEAVAGAGGHSQAADANFERAIEVFRRLTLPWDEAEAFELWALARGRSYRGRNRQAFVGEKLGASRSVYSRIGAGQPWFDRLAALEQRLVTSPEPAALPDKLTPREVEVLVLIAHGRSNKEIGRELVLSVRTVERHLANVYLKTGLHSHAQAASYAFAHGLASIES